ncbi:uncharacterized protein TNCV_884471 [Trichonephila clavipes]|nr:uncharacterized protein TNCV_884471 [Trichonephila clavipes]
MENTHRRPSGKRPKKRNQFMKVCSHTYVAERRDTNKCASSNKISGIQTSLKSNLVKVSENFKGYRIFDFISTFSSILSVSCCLKCHKPLTINEKSTRGLCSNFEIRCKNCGSVCTFSSCENTGNKNNALEINRRSILAMRCIGQGLELLKTFCAVMSLPNPVEQKSYDVINNKLSRVMKEVTEESMKRAAVEENSSSPDNLLTVSGDGTWKTRGHSSLIGVCTVIGAETGKVLDREVLSSFCKGCESYKGVKFGIKYNKWQRAHKISCRKNYSGSAGKMEVDGMLRIFNRSEKLHNLKYSNYIGDGDTKTFNALSENKPYGDDHLIQKIECVGHVQKRMGRLTDSLIDKLAHYYGNAIRCNSTSVKEMRKAIWAVWGHSCSTDDEPMHWFCPTNPNTWCKYNAAINNNLQNYKHKPSVAKAVRDVIKPVFADLSHPALLKKCLGGKTQNPNESLNSLIWKFCPKTIGSSLQIAEIAANLATSVFNDGNQILITILEKFGLKINRNVCVPLSERDNRRIFTSRQRLLESSFEARRAKKIKKSKEIELFQEQEEVWQACRELKTSTIKDPPYRRGRCSLKMSRLRRSPVAVEIRWFPELRCRPRHLTMVQDYEVCCQ